MEKVNDLLPQHDKHRNCTLQELGTDASEEIAVRAYHCINHNENFTVPVAVTTLSHSLVRLDSID